MNLTDQKNSAMASLGVLLRAKEKLDAEHRDLHLRINRLDRKIRIAEQAVKNSHLPIYNLVTYDPGTGEACVQVPQRIAGINRHFVILVTDAGGRYEYRRKDGMPKYSKHKCQLHPIDVRKALDIWYGEANTTVPA